MTDDELKKLCKELSPFMQEEMTNLITLFGQLDGQKPFHGFISHFLFNDIKIQDPSTGEIASEEKLKTIRKDTFPALMAINNLLIMQGLNQPTILDAKALSAKLYKIWSKIN